jgi:hypothetical protein
VAYFRESFRIPNSPPLRYHSFLHRVVAFCITDVEGNYSLISGRDWIHTNQCVPSTLHQMLLQWVGDDIECMLMHQPASSWSMPLYYGPMRLLHVSQE